MQFIPLEVSSSPSPNLSKSCFASLQAALPTYRSDQ